MTRIALTIAFVALAGCSSSTSPKPAPTSDSSAPTGWRAVVGEGGTFVHTFDEHDWTVRSLGNVDLYGVSCIGNDVGWAVGAHGVIAHTEDGGRTWSWQSSGTTTSLRAVAFDDLTHGIAVGDDGFVRTTIDGGQRWDAPLAGGEALPLRAAWANGGTFYAAGHGATFFHGSFGALAPTVIAGAGDLGAITARGEHVVVGDEAGALFESFDRGAHFQKTGTAGHAVRALAIAEDGHIVAVGDAGLLLESYQTGTWIAPSIALTADLHAAVPTRTGIFVAGDHGTLLVLDGKRADVIPLGTSANLWAIDSFE